MPTEIQITECREHELGVIVSFQVFDHQGNLAGESSLSYSKLMTEQGLLASIRSEAEHLIAEKNISAPDLGGMIGQRIPLASLPTINQVQIEEEKI